MPAKADAPLIAIIGLGQIGGSIVLSLRKNKAPYRITGIDTSAKRLRLLKHYLDRSDTNWEAARDSDIVILCLHYESIRKFLQDAPRDQLITDVCSGKFELLQLANRRKLRFIGGHPMVGNEFVGEKGWRDDLFEKGPYFICPAKSATANDLNMIRQLVKALHARAINVSAKEHDRFVAKTSHFPAFLSSILKEAGKSVPIEFQGPGFRSMIRLANTSPDLLQTFLKSNRENILATANEFRERLEKFIFNAEAQRPNAAKPQSKKNKGIRR
jgi:prephenate dehydrogenase